MRAAEFTAVLGANEAAMTVYRGLKWSTIDAVPRLVRLSSVAALEALLGDAAALPDRLPLPPRVAPNAKSTVVPADQSLAGWDQCWQERFAPSLVSVWKDAGYLRWRYLDHPRFRYEVYFASDEAGRIAGCTVYRIAHIPQRSCRVLRIVEFLGEGAVGDELAGHLASTADAQGVAFSDFYCTSSAPAAPLARQGFVPEADVPLAIPSLLQPVDFSRRSLTAAFHVQSSIVRDSSSLVGEGLYFTRSDGDQDRPN
jgi:hypothetical protein